MKQLLIAAILGCILAWPETPLFAQECPFSAVAEELSERADSASQRAGENLNHLCTAVTLADIKASQGAQKCLGADSRLFSETDAAILRKALGATASSTLRTLIPAVATFLSRPLVGIVAALAIPEQLGADALDVLGHPGSHSKSELNSAARQLIWTTDPPALRDHTTIATKATVDACLLAR